MSSSPERQETDQVAYRCEVLAKVKLLRLDKKEGHFLGEV